jgi:hypothetical protein
LADNADPQELQYLACSALSAPQFSHRIASITHLSRLPHPELNKLMAVILASNLRQSRPSWLSRK